MADDRNMRKGGCSGAPKRRHIRRLQHGGFDYLGLISEEIGMEERKAGDRPCSMRADNLGDNCFSKDEPENSIPLRESGCGLDVKFKGTKGHLKLLCELEASSFVTLSIPRIFSH
jgi:hypothetical protein